MLPAKAAGQGCPGVDDGRLTAGWPGRCRGRYAGAGRL